MPFLSTAGHRRHGHLFQNRYQSILCQGELYLLELVRTIHLNPLRAGVVSSMEGLERFAHSGHGQILGHNQQSWMAADEILHRFGKGWPPLERRISPLSLRDLGRGKGRI